MSSIEEQIDEAINESVEAQSDGTDDDFYDEPRGDWKRVGASRFVATDGVGGMARVRHEGDIKLGVELTPDKVSVWSREAGIDIEVDHEGEMIRPWRNVESDPAEGQVVAQSSGGTITENPFSNIGDEGVKRQFVNQWEAVHGTFGGDGGAFRQATLHLGELELRDRGIDPKTVLENSRVDFSAAGSSEPKVRAQRTAETAPERGEGGIYAQVPGEDAMEGVESKEDLSRPAQRVVEHIDMTHLRDRLEGRADGTLRSSKPTAQDDTGFEQYVWRMARFHSGDDPKIPVTASWWLQDWLDDQGIDASVSGILDEEGKQITAILNVVSKLIVRSFGRSPQGGLERWQKALFG